MKCDFRFLEVYEDSEINQNFLCCALMEDSEGNTGSVVGEDDEGSFSTPICDKCPVPRRMSENLEIIPLEVSIYENEIFTRWYDTENNVIIEPEIEEVI